MRATRIVTAVAVLAAGCTRNAGREYELRGQIIALDPARQQVTIRHEDIPQFMPGMTMAFKVENPNLLDGRVAGDLVRATLVVRDNDARLRTLEKTGFSPVSDTETVPVVPLSPGEQVADAVLVDETGATRRFTDWRGSVVAVTFIYTRCPLPNFCPLMDRHFKAVQEGIRQEPRLGNVRLLSVSFDPRHDTPPVLSGHAKKLDADPRIWRFATGQVDEIDAFAKQFGVSVVREPEAGAEILHNLRTAIIDTGGRVVAILNGSEWTPAELLDRLRAVT